MGQAFNLALITNVNFNGADCAKVMLDGVRIWERYTASRQVWVSSGYNQTTFQHIATTTPSTGQWHYAHDKFSVNLWGIPSIGNYKYYKSNATRSYRITTHWAGTRRYTRGAYFGSIGREGRLHALIIYDNVTTYVDTSSYQAENYTAYYT